jgi:membrane-associated phospholipid phosphatase
MLYFLILIEKTLAQQDSTYSSICFDKKYIISYWTDTKKIVAAPFQWKAGQWSAAAGITGAWIVTYVYDEEIYDLFQVNQSETTDNISKYLIEPWGSGLYSLPLLAGIYLTGIKNNHHKNVALTGLKAYLLSGGAAMVTKHLFHRHRPSDDDPPDPYLWEGPFYVSTDYTSFPSGHTTTAFAIASVLTHGYKNKLWVGLTSYTVAALVGFSRINDGEHWASDVIAGAALGTFIGTTLSKINFNNGSNFRISATYVREGLGMSLIYRLD